ncbi:hypothetical protein [Aeromonas salmonicida]|jgi:hypothetical protein|uniref:hypothetical protein n=1 Tax=Aeromonas salmonicida TaxID=645 RepID=UPI0039A4558E
MSKIYEMVRNETRNALENEGYDDSPLLKPVTVRIPEAYLKLADRIAANSNGTRQGLLCAILISGIDEALEGYSSVFENPKAVADELLLESGFTPYAKPESAE